MEVDDPNPTNAALGEDDPITASYNVFINPSLPLGRRLLVLQHPNRTDDQPRHPPSEIRLKSRAGLVEVDIPLDHNSAYDREKGLKWGRALRSSMAVKSGGSHGLAGGFGVGAVPQRGAGGSGAGGRKRGGDAADEEDDDGMEWNEAVRQDKVLRIQTLGGQYPETKEVQHMVGVFQGQDLHLTPVSSLVHLRPQLHHIDATAQLERHTTSRESGPSTAGAPSSTTAGPRAIHMTIKTTADGEVVTTETIADRLRSVQSEPWRVLRYTDEHEEAAWDIYNESLFLRPKVDGDQANTNNNSSNNDNGVPTITSTAKETVAEEAAAAAEENTALEESVPGFGIRWTDDQLLEAVSGIKKPRPEEILEAAKAAKGKEIAGATPMKSQADEPKKPKGRPRGGAAAGSSRRGGRGRSTA